jgi:tetratricopeptide (TPR) repeat protein
MSTDTTNPRGDAWELGLQGRYDAALEIMEGLLSKAPTDIESLRMKGNLLELKAMDLLEHSVKKLTSSSDYLAARQCYESILEIDPRNVTAHIDLGDHYRNLGAKDRALDYYKLAATHLENGDQSRPAWKQAMQELLERVGELGGSHSRAAEADALKTWCKRSIGLSD